MNRRILYPTGMSGIIAICILLAILGAGLPLPAPPDLNFGIAVSSPNLWHLGPILGEILNVGALGICALILYFVNKNFSLIRTGQPLGTAFFLPLCFANLMIGGRWSATPLVTLLTLIIYATLFTSFRAKNATRNLFFVATCLSVGSLFEYAFIALAVAAFISTFLLECMRPKEFFAMGLGILAPYWVLIGFGIINPLEMSMPHPVSIFSGNLHPATFIQLTFSGVMALCAVILSLYNGLILYAGNSRVRRSILVMNTFGVTSAIAMLLDVNNIQAYMGVCNIWFAIQLANLFTLRELRRGGLLFWLLQLLIISMSIIFFFTL